MMNHPAIVHRALAVVAKLADASDLGSDEAELTRADASCGFDPRLPHHSADSVTDVSSGWPRFAAQWSNPGGHGMKKGITEMATQQQIEDAWERTATIRGRDPNTWRRDEAGNVIRHGSYGTTGEYGWELDHRNPVSRGGTDHGRNLRALHWEENRAKGDKY